MQFLPQGRQPGLNPGHLRLSGPQTGHQGVNFLRQLLPVPGIRELKVDHVLALRLQNLSQGLSVRTIALAGDDDRADLGMILQGGVNALDPGADGAREAGGFGLGHPGPGPGLDNEQVIEVHRSQARGQHHFHRDGGGEAHPGARGRWFNEGHGLVMDRRPETKTLTPSPVLPYFRSSSNLLGNNIISETGKNKRRKGD